MHVRWIVASRETASRRHCFQDYGFAPLGSKFQERFLLVSDAHFFGASTLEFYCASGHQGHPASYVQATIRSCERCTLSHSEHKEVGGNVRNVRRLVLEGSWMNAISCFIYHVTFALFSLSVELCVFDITRKICFHRSNAYPNLI
jgi:hypothetical protein